VGGFELSRLVSAALALLIAGAPAYAGSAARPEVLTARNEVVSSTQAAANQKETAYAQSVLDRLGIGRSAAAPIASVGMSDGKTLETLMWGSAGAIVGGFTGPLGAAVGGATGAVAGFIYGAFFVSGRKSKIKPAEKK